MKALYYTAPMQSEIREVAQPKAQAGETIIDVSHCGICGSDMHAWHGLDERRQPPIILGHEAVGVAREGKHAGKRVAINPLHSCGACENCKKGNVHLCEQRRMISMQLPGANAEQCVASEENLFRIDESLSFETAALAEPLAVCVHAIEVAKRTASIAESEVIILGGGAIGILCGILIENEKCKSLSIAESSAPRMQMLKKILSNANIYNPQDESPKPGQANIILDCVGSKKTRQAASQLVAPGGTIVHVGLQESGDALDTRYFTLQEITFAGTYCYTPKNFQTALDLLSAGIIKEKSWIDTRPLSEGAKSFQEIHKGSKYAKIILAM